MEIGEELSKIISPEDMKAFQTIDIRNPENLKVGEEYKGHVFTPGFSPAAAKFAYEKWTPKTGDVFLMSFPKTGTNWMAEILRQILYQDEKWNKISSALPFMAKVIEIGDGRKFDVLDKLPLPRRLLGSHLPADIINIDKIKQVKAKVVYVLRNPKDQIVSWYKFLPSVPPGKVEPLKSMVSEGWDKYFEHAVAGDFPVGMKPGDWYPEHILSWYKYLDNKSVYFVQYEDLKENLPKQIKLLAEFLEVPMTDEKANKIAEACTFDTMKKNLTNGNTLFAQFAAINMRKGEVGGWKDYFTVRQSERIDAIMGEKLKGTNIEFRYK